MWDLATIKQINTPTEVAKARALAKKLNRRIKICRDSEENTEPK
tara:strand:+ start:747 stop:878 length:132 start_codon:yes stop_codon:yes gene_type:complete